jgi:hypothetical protein
VLSNKEKNAGDGTAGLLGRSFINYATLNAIQKNVKLANIPISLDSARGTY